MNDFITDVEQQYEVYCKIAEEHGFIDLDAKKNGFRCTTKSSEFNAGWIAFTGAVAAVRDEQQAIIDSLKAQLNNMEACYIGVKKELEDAIYLKDEHRKRRCQLAKQLTQKSLRLTEAEFEYKRIKGLQSKDCLQIMRLTARNEKLSDEVKALRGEHE